MDVVVFSSLGVEQKSVGDPLRLFVVDHHEIYRHGLRDLLTSAGDFQVVAEAERYQDAVRQVVGLPVDTILIDLELPDLQGMEVLHRLREVVPFLRMVILTDSLRKELLLEAMLAGVNGYLTREMLATDIVATLQNLRRGELALSPTLSTIAIQLLVEQARNLHSQLHTLPGGGEMRKTQALQLNGEQDGNSTAMIAHHPLLSLLTSQEYRVFQLMRQGLSNKQIAVQLSISPFTVGKHVQHILRKLGVMNRTQAASSVFSGAETVLDR
ncbi:MAG TPA: response regulator transcription factor [Ktedonobacteraceae bacterium]|nr:response regulator transcription factor [Ktedonobacteraceae bacterium]